MGTKSAFVRANPNVPAQDLLAMAEKQGIPLTVGYIYNIRASTKAKGGEVKAAGRATAERGAAPASGGSGLEAQLRTLIIRIGLDRAEQVFAQLKKSLSS
jgi:hypothetical protein